MTVAAWKIPRIWEGGKCFILGGGPSVPRVFGVPEKLIQKVCDQQEPVEVLSDYYKPIHGQHVIGINNAYKLGSWVDVLFFGDGSWFEVHEKHLAHFRGIKVSCCPKFEDPAYARGLSVKYVKKDHSRGTECFGLSESPRMVFWNNHSGGAAIDLAAHMGVRTIMLLGFDMRSSQVAGKETTHWHGAHYEKHKNLPPEKIKPPNYVRHLRCFKKIRQEAKARGIRIFLVGNDSAIDCFERISLEEALKA